MIYRIDPIVGKELRNQVKQIKKHVAYFSGLLSDLESVQTCKYDNQKCKVSGKISEIANGATCSCGQVEVCYGRD